MTCKKCQEKNLIEIKVGNRAYLLLIGMYATEKLVHVGNVKRKERLQVTGRTTAGIQKLEILVHVFSCT